MLNYISAEWYKLRHTKGIFVAFGFLLVLILLIFLPKFWYAEPSFAVYAAAYVAFLPIGFFLAPVFAAKAFDDQFGRGTLKNEVVFGIPRYRSYLGKLSIGALTGTGAAMIVLGFYLLLSWISHGFGEEYVSLAIEICVQATLLTLPLWLASMSLAFCLQVTIKNSSAALALDYLLLIIGVPLSMMEFEGEIYSPVMVFFNKWFFAAPFRVVYGEIGRELTNLSGLGYSWLIGLGWIAATSLVGITVFRQQEIK